MPPQNGQGNPTFQQFSNQNQPSGMMPQNNPGAGMGQNPAWFNQGQQPGQGGITRE